MCIRDSDKAMDFGSSQFAKIKIDDKFGIIDSGGNEIIKAKYENLSSFCCNDRLAKVYIDSLWGYINTKDEIVIEPLFDFAGCFSDSGYANVRIGDKYSFIDMHGNMLHPPKYDIATFVDNQNMARVTLNNKFGLIRIVD